MKTNKNKIELRNFVCWKLKTEPNRIKFDYNPVSLFHNYCIKSQIKRPDKTVFLNSERKPG